MQLTHSVLKLIILFLKIGFLCNKLFLTNVIVIVIVIAVAYLPESRTFMVSNVLAFENDIQKCKFWLNNNFFD